MKRFSIFFLLLFPIILCAEVEERDTLKIIYLDEVRVYSHKETMSQQVPISSTVLTLNTIHAAQMNSIRDLSVFVPNFFIPDYGSAMSSVPYIRGVGSRSSGQSMALYVDHVPYFEKSTFDFDFYDIRQIEILRGPQGTLYGRNALGGIVNMYTLSPFEYQGTRLSATGGSYGLAKIRAAHYDMINEKIGWSVSGYYNHTDGFFRNQYNHRSADDKSSAGGRVRIEWLIRPNLHAQYIFNYDYVDQSAFPYGLYDPSTGKTLHPNYNDENRYSRSIANNSLLLDYLTDKIQVTSSSSYQYFSDDMKMDQDFSPQSYFSLAQRQNQHAFNEEIVIRSKTSGNYQWSFGLTSFIQKLDTDAPVAFKEDGLKNILQPVFDQIAQNPNAPTMIITNDVMDIPGSYNTKTWGGALFHQSTFNHLFVEGLSITAGLRADFERTDLDYFTHTHLDLDMVRGPMRIPISIADTLKGKTSLEFSEILPKIALKYAWNDRQFVYATVSKGYKAGGYNIQMFSDLMQTQLMNQTPSAPEVNVSDVIAYQPEHSVNYEIGYQASFLDNRLRTQLSLFYMDISDMQLTKFVPSGNGRMITNAGEVTSKGAELSLQAYLGKGFGLDINYGYAHASFADYTDSVKIGNAVQEVDYKGKFVPYAPQNTVGVNGNYIHSFHHAFIDHIRADVQYLGTGKIYWHEANSLFQNFYHTLNAKIGIARNNVELEIWGKNLLNTYYHTFYFESFGNQFFQKGKPFQWGVSLNVSL